MKKKNYNSVKEAAHALRIFMQICFVASLGAAALTAVIGFVLLAVPGAFSFFAKPFFPGTGSLGIELNDMLKYSIDPGAITVEKMKPAYLAIIFKTSACTLISAPFLYQLKSILQSAENGMPFEPENAKRLSWMGGLLIVNSIVYRIGEYIVLHMTMNAVSIPNMTVDFSFNSSGLLMGILLFIFAGIFRYGNYLQKEFDATL